jgi:membrane peptidoglycan carboxypeptidase
MTGGCLPAKTWKSFMGPALKDVPVTEFNEPAPIKIISDKISKQARTGIDPGNQRKPQGTGVGGPYMVGPAAPTAEAPTTTAPGQSSQPPSGGAVQPSPRPTTTTTSPPPNLIPRP